MSTVAVRFAISRMRCYWRPLILTLASIVLVGLFWFGTRYPQLLSKADHLGQAIPSMAYTSQLMVVAKDASVWMRILAATVNWLDSMKIGMTFGVLFGALLHTILRYYPLKIGKNLYLNSLKGALVGIPMGVCANCAVPTACGVTRGHGRIEVALGFLFSSPNFNPVVVMMTIMALPMAMVVTKYAILLLVILFVVPTFIRWLERDKPLEILTTPDEGASCSIVQPQLDECTEKFTRVFKELSSDFGKHVWMLLKPTITLMLLASIVSATVLTLVPWESLLTNVTPLKATIVSFISVFMPVPIALDVMFAAQLQQQGIAAGYVMLFAMTLGTFSIIPSVYLWREVSKRLSVLLFLFFVVIGVMVALIF
ncbi:MAG TPA: permease [Gemmatales bacterium]|nr:permease [Gemmatales bacterium]